MNDRKFQGNGHTFYFQSADNGFAFQLADGRGGSGVAAGATAQPGGGSPRTMTGTTPDGTTVSASLGELGEGASAYITYPGEAPISFAGTVEEHSA